MQKMSFPNLIIGKIESIGVVIALISLTIMMLLTTVDTLSRLLFNFPIPGTLELVEEYCMVPLIFLPLSYVYVRGGHVKVDLFEQFFPDVMKRVLNVFNPFLTIIFFVPMIFGTWNSFLSAVDIRLLSNSVWAYPMAPAYFLVTFGCILMLLRATQVFVLQLAGKELPQVK